MTALPRVDAATIPAIWWLQPFVMKAESSSAPELPNFASLLALPAELGAARLPLRDALELREIEPKSYLLLPLPMNTTLSSESAVARPLRAPEFAGPLVVAEPPPSPWRYCHACLAALNATAIHEHVAHWRLLARGGGASSGMDGHTDALALGSWSRQLAGRKRWRLCGESCLEVTLQPGETLVYPPRWWHETNTIDVGALSVSGSLIAPPTAVAFFSQLRRRICGDARGHLLCMTPRVPCARACRRPRS